MRVDPDFAGVRRDRRVVGVTSLFSLDLRKNIRFLGKSRMDTLRPPATAGGRFV
jgi:hypothetical protein